jgi:AraC-like DNA-binding protein
MSCSRIRPLGGSGARMFFKVRPLGDLGIGVTSASSGLVYESVPSTPAATGERMFYLLMPNQPRIVGIAGKQFVQHAGECVLIDSAIDVIATYKQPHAGVCLSIPEATVRQYVPNPERFLGTRFATSGALSRVIGTLLLSVWEIAASGGATSDGRQAADALLRVLGRCYARSAVRGERAETATKICCEQVKACIDADIRNPALTVQLVAARVGVTTRYLQLLFAAEGDCVSDYIKRQRLRGCLLDLRDSDCDHQSITEIAFSWGFNSAAHFSSLFRREYGLRPRDYRANNLDQFADLRVTQVEGALLDALSLLHRPLGRGPRIPPLGFEDRTFRGAMRLGA